MKRGPPPAKGFDIALPIALMRGRVMQFQPLPDHVCNFTITGNGIFALVRLMSATRLHAAIAEIDWIYTDAITGLCSIPFGGPVSRELWLYSRYGTMRFFRLLETGLIEIDCHGFPFINGKPVVALPTSPGPDPFPSGLAVPVPGSPVPAAPAATGLPDPGPYDPKSPIIRGLERKNAEKKPEPGVNDPIDLGVKKDPAHKKPAAMKNQVPVVETVIPIREMVANSPAGSSCNELSARRPDHISSPGKAGDEI
jgi:hypothetical protein